MTMNDIALVWQSLSFVYLKYSCLDTQFSMMQKNNIDILSSYINPYWDQSRHMWQWQD